MRAVIGHHAVELDMHQLQASSRQRQSASRLARSITYGHDGKRESTEGAREAEGTWIMADVPFKARRSA